ncbi:aldehyde dehydrogenase [Rhizobium leguminosarum bv. viciae]|nr:aldehyde dehydrogenase [Rhizobium leguminosarum bv. viciae]
MTLAPLRVAINGFGRIGRTVLRQALARPFVDVVLINDIAAPALSAYLFQYDSVFGPWQGSVQLADGDLEIDGRYIRMTSAVHLSELDLGGIDVLFECTGSSISAANAVCSLEKGVSQVIVSGPADWAEKTLILGANESAFRGERIISNGSCTTNALAPLLRTIDELFGVVGAQMTTVHCYTGSQPTVDQPRGDFARSRAAALSMVPTTTSAHHLLKNVLPDLAELVEARAIRVPTPSVSAIDLTVALRDLRSEEQVIHDLRTAAGSSLVLGWTEEPVVSVDLRGRPESLVLCGPEISLGRSGLLRVFGWYDNEWAFSARMLDMAEHLRKNEDR